ncbi:MAG TPA: bifunctional DNA-formamidopyrimidine glycosylase/DNA-(apurinic or apyrimidinic site) lyase [Ktedonobacteraceae bacterium]|jgi:formamidopyrimidine-DNA glycosylase|nr:bifunctional DNA-formamidopyrimidine glycosylase/DNA-(apurinic or apyrimidinic site) lyase [Ktedonobacteraceae bacterium]
MPELPEVEYTARQLRETIIGATIQDALVFWDRTIGHPDPNDFRAEIAELRIEEVRRRAKYLIVDLAGGEQKYILTIHRRMTGNLLLLAPGWELDTSLRERDPVAWNTKGPIFHGYTIRRTHCYSTQQGEKTEQDEEKKDFHAEIGYCRACFILEDGRCLLFTDPRKFGRIELWPQEQELQALAGLGLEPLSEAFTLEELQARLAGRRGNIKQALLNQEILAGLGNIYADEALYYARIHPLRPANTLTLEELRLLREGIIAVLTLGIEHGGTSFSEYRDLWGEAGDNFSHVQVYQQEGKPCQRCGTLIERIVVAQRSTHFCPTCQQLIGE